MVLLDRGIDFRRSHLLVVAGFRKELPFSGPPVLPAGALLCAPNRALFPRFPFLSPRLFPLRVAPLKQVIKRRLENRLHARTPGTDRPGPFQLLQKFFARGKADLVTLLRLLLGIGGRYGGRILRGIAIKLIVISSLIIFLDYPCTCRLK